MRVLIELVETDYAPFTYLHGFLAVRASLLTGATSNATLVIVHCGAILGLEHSLGLYRAGRYARSVGAMIAKERSGCVLHLGKLSAFLMDEVRPVEGLTILAVLCVVFCFACDCTGATAHTFLEVYNHCVLCHISVLPFLGLFYFDAGKATVADVASAQALGLKRHNFIVINTSGDRFLEIPGGHLPVTIRYGSLCSRNL